MKKLSFIVLALTLLWVLLLCACETAYSPLKKGLVFTEMEGGYMVEPMPIDITPKRIAKKVLTTVSLDIPKSYLGRPVVGVRGFFIYPALAFVTIPETVTVIEENAFGPLVQGTEYGGAVYIGSKDNPYHALLRPKSNDIESLEIHPDTKIIADGALDKYDELESITFKGIIPPYDYDSIPSLSSVVFDASELQGGNTFHDDGLADLMECDTLSTVVLKGNAAYGLDLKSTVTELIIEGDTSIPSNCFEGYTSLERVEIAGSLTTVGDYAFEGCTSLISVTVGGSVKTVSPCAFKDCTALTSVSLGDSVSYVADRAFENCSSLSVLKIGSSLSSFGKGAFVGCTAPIAPTLDENNQAFSIINGSLYSKDGTVLLYCLACDTDGGFDIPSSVTSIGKEAFYGLTSLKNIVIPDTVTSIGEAAFKGCTALESIRLGGSITSIGIAAFADCGSLASIDLPTSLCSIGHLAFANCALLTDVEIPDTVTSIGTEAFYGCSALESITLPYVYNYAFGYVFGRSSFPDSEPTLEYPDPGAATYYIPSSLKSVTVTGGSLHKNAFSGCASIESIILGDSVTDVGGSTFSGCTSLEAVRIPETATSIGAGAFANCESLKSIKIPESVTSIKVSAFANCTSLESINIPSSVTSIGWRSFYGCVSLVSVSISDSLTTIPSKAFYGCTSLESVIIPDTVTQILDEAFSGCTALASAEFESADGWHHAKTTSASGTPISSADLADPAKAAEYLSKTLCNHCWTRTK